MPTRIGAPENCSVTPPGAMALGLKQTRALCSKCCNIRIAPAIGPRAAVMAGALSTSQPVLAEASIDAHSTLVPDTYSTSTSTMDANSRGGAASVSHGQAVPENLEQLVRVFASHPSVYIPVMALLLLVSQRLQSPWTPWDLGVVAFVSGFWLLQEWIIHAKLLHSKVKWFGRDIHDVHHAKEYFHVSIDGTPLIVGVMGIAFVVWWLLFGGTELSLTASITYFIMGLNYEWIHYLVHTKYVPKSKWLRDVRRHHMLHHCRNEDYWLSFSLPAVDALFGTLPRSGASVPLTQMARQAHKSAGRPTVQ